jgi:Cu/Ag efflux protein CusF
MAAFTQTHHRSFAMATPRFVFGAIAGLSLALSIGVPAFAATGTVAVESAPGAVGAAATVQASGTITAIDAETRTVTIQGDGGRTVSLVAGPDVRNFDQLAVGQRVDAEYVQALTLELEPGSTAPISRTIDAGIAGAQEGERPAGMLGRRVTIVARVTALDPEHRTVTLEGPERTVELTVDDPAQFARVKLDDRIRVVYVEAAALSVQPAE